MTTLREAAQQALEAIIELEYSSSTAVGDRMAREAKQALRQALEAERQEWEPVAWMTRFNDPERGSYEKPADTHLKRDEAERQVQRHIYKRLCKLRVEPLYAHPQSVQQPLPPQSDIPLTAEQLTVFKYGWKCAEEAHGIGGKA
jgi:hypothetical protein